LVHSALPPCAISFPIWSGAPGGPTLLHSVMRQFVQRLPRLLDSHRHCLSFAGGRSFGGRMTRKPKRSRRLPGVRGLAFLGFPLHPAGRPSDERAQHLFHVQLPMLFIQGTRDELQISRSCSRSRSSLARAPH